MKKIECYIRLTDADPIIAALAKSGVGGVTSYPVSGFGRQRARGSNELLPKMKIEIFALDIEVEKILSVISSIAKKGRFGDGKIVVLPVDDVVRVRTGEKGAKALY